MNKPKTILVRDILDLIGLHTYVRIEVKKTGETLFDGTIFEMGHMPWQHREVVWMRPDTNGFILEVE